jgi:hypothetical protein
MDFCHRVKRRISSRMVIPSKAPLTSMSMQGLKEHPPQKQPPAANSLTST